MKDKPLVEATSKAPPAPHSSAQAKTAPIHLPSLPTPSKSSTVNKKPATTIKGKDKKGDGKLARISSASNDTARVCSGHVKTKPEEIIELGSGRAVPSGGTDNDPGRRTVINIYLSTKKPDPPKPAIPLFDVSEHKLMRIRIQQLQALLDCVHDAGQFTPLVIDPTGRVEVYFTYGGEALIFDCKKTLVKCDVQKIVTHEEAKEEIRQTLVNGLKYGKTVVFTMLNSAFAFEKYHDPSFFPETVLERGGVTFRKEMQFEPILRKDDYDTNGFFVVNEDWPFRVVVTTNFELEDYEEFLQSSLTLSNFLPIYIETEKRETD
ncbi:hypothetical protein BC830DRAFT_1109710 [Chytriomyces sp. MP71]|nr:hypothetical protein BC830DRAFT_1109710 [Chytriomyces sp. MP71]